MNHRASDKACDSPSAAAVAAVPAAAGEPWDENLRALLLEYMEQHPWGSWAEDADYFTCDFCGAGHNEPELLDHSDDCVVQRLFAYRAAAPVPPTAQFLAADAELHAVIPPNVSHQVLETMPPLPKEWSAQVVCGKVMAYGVSKVSPQMALAIGIINFLTKYQEAQTTKDLQVPADPAAAHLTTLPKERIVQGKKVPLKETQWVLEGAYRHAEKLRDVTGDAEMNDLHIPVEKTPPMEPPGTVLLGAIDKRAYLYLSMDAKRMVIERQNAREHGIQDPVDFLFEFEGLRFKIKYDDLLAALVTWDGTLPVATAPAVPEAVVGQVREALEAAVLAMDVAWAGLGDRLLAEGPLDHGYAFNVTDGLVKARDQTREALRLLAPQRPR